MGRAYAEAAAREGLAAPAVDVTGETVARLAQKGDPLALEVMGRAGEALGTAVASLAMILDIDLYVIGGSVAKAGELLLAPARRAHLPALVSIGLRARPHCPVRPGR